MAPPADQPATAQQTRPRRWRWALLGCLVVVLIVASAIGSHNQRQWGRALKFKRQIEQSGGQCELAAQWGTSFCRFRFSRADSLWQRPLMWPTAGLVRLLPKDQPLVVDWSAADQLELHYLVIFSSQFSDADLQSIPSSTPLWVLRLESPGITNGSLEKIREFTTLRELSSRDSQIDGAALLKLARETELKFDPRLTVRELQAFGQANLVHRITDFEVVSQGDFRAAQLKGVRSGGDCIFRGAYDPEAFVGIKQVLQKPFVDFKEAELNAASLSDIAQMTGIRRLRLVKCTISGSVLPAAEPISSADELEMVIEDTNITPDHLRAFTGRKMRITFDGHADDAWLDGVMKIPGIQSVVLIGTEVSDEALAKHAFDASYSGQGPLKPFARRVPRPTVESPIRD